MTRLDTKAFRRGERDLFALVSLRWWLFKKLSALGWWICPEPHKSRLQSVTPSWKQMHDWWGISE